MAGHKGHEFVWVKNVDHQLRHEADSDELRAVAEESAEGLREHFYWQKSRKPEESFDTGCGVTPYPAGNIMQIQ